jgi:hypothetical protein
MYEDNPFFAVLDVVSWDASGQRHILHEKSGSIWVATEDGRFLPGNWRLNIDDGNICYIIGGINEGCFSVSKKGESLAFSNDVSGKKFVLDKSDRDAPFISAIQHILYVQVTRASGALEVPEEGRSGKEIIYWHPDGRIHVIQPEGWVKVGSWWFDDKDAICDNINVQIDCLPIVKIQQDMLYLDYFIDDGRMRLEVELEYFDR